MGFTFGACAASPVERPPVSSASWQFTLFWAFEHFAVFAPSRLPAAPDSAFPLARRWDSAWIQRLTTRTLMECRTTVDCIRDVDIVFQPYSTLLLERPEVFRAMELSRLRIWIRSPRSWELLMGERTLRQLGGDALVPVDPPRLMTIEDYIPRAPSDSFVAGVEAYPALILGRCAVWGVLELSVSEDRYAADMARAQEETARVQAELTQRISFMGMGITPVTGAGSSGLGQTSSSRPQILFLESGSLTTLLLSMIVYGYVFMYGCVYGLFDLCWICVYCVSGYVYGCVSGYVLWLWFVMAIGAMMLMRNSGFLLLSFLVVPDCDSFFENFWVELGFQDWFLSFEPSSRPSGCPAGFRVGPRLSGRNLRLPGRAQDFLTGDFLQKDLHTARNGSLGVSEKGQIRVSLGSMASSSNDPDSLVTLHFHDFRVERMRHWWTLLGEDDHADIVGFFGKFPPFMRLTGGSHVPPWRSMLSFFQLDSPFSETPGYTHSGSSVQPMCLEKYLGLTTADLLTKYFSRSAFPARLARDFIAGKKEWKKFRINAFKIAFAGIFLFPTSAGRIDLGVIPIERQGEGVPMFCTQLLQLWFCSHLQAFLTASRLLITFERHTVSQTVQIALPFTGNSRAWALYLLDLPLRWVGLEGYLGASSIVDALDSLCPLRWSASSWGVGLYRATIPALLFVSLAVFSTRLVLGRLGCEMVLIEEGSRPEIALLPLWTLSSGERGGLPFFTPQAYSTARCTIFLDISLPSGISLHCLREEASAARVESLRSTLHHNSVAVANVRRDLVAQRGNVSTLRTMNEFIREQLEISLRMLRNSWRRTWPRLGSSWRLSRRRGLGSRMSLILFVHIPRPLVDPATGRPQDIVALRRALDASEEALTSARTSMGVMRVQISVLQGDNGVLQSELDLWCMMLLSPMLLGSIRRVSLWSLLFHQINQVMDSLGTRARAVWEEHDEGDPALSTALGRFCRETCIRLGH
uniref:Aminotransferase-like plant mobile domain-containing protein n=1 Tax=Fagus sylvatica TaxID=28930 RepID=A0A2N9GR99_FAGSY